MISRRMKHPIAGAKRLIDALAAAVLLVVLVPLLGVVAFAVKLDMGSPVLFRQRRCGRNGGLFQLLKFRTMTTASGHRELSSDAERVTALGRTLRSTSLDELPSLWNVLKGDMSLVGPRPLLPEYLPLYTSEQARRHEVRPGITGWAQVNGRNALSWEKRFELDVWYVDNMSLWLDLRILALTVIKVFRREGISQPGHATMEPFRGTAS